MPVQCDSPDFCIYRSERESDLANKSHFSTQVCMHSTAMRDSNKQLGCSKNCESVGVKEYWGLSLIYHDLISASWLNGK